MQGTYVKDTVGYNPFSITTGDDVTLNPKHPAMAHLRGLEGHIGGSTRGIYTPDSQVFHVSYTKDGVWYNDDFRPSDLLPRDTPPPPTPYEDLVRRIHELAHTFENVGNNPELANVFRNLIKE